MKDSPPAETRVGQYRLDWSLGTVSNGGTAPIMLRPQALAVLKVLNAKPGTLISKDELMTAVWPGIAVTDDSLVQCITEIRKALGDEGHTIIKTVPKRGYVFEPPEFESPKVQAKIWWITGTVAALIAVSGLAAYTLRPEPGRAAVHRPGVAVLPFDNLTGDLKWNRLADGLTEDVITDLARFGHLNVMARHSVEPYKGKAVDVREAGKALGADYVIEGSVQAEGGSLRVSAQLIDAESGGHIWSQRWDRKDPGNIALQSEVAASMAGDVAGIYTQGIIVQAEAAKARLKSPDARTAYEHFLIAADAKARRTKESVAEGFEAIDRALTLDPDFAKAYLTRGWLHLFSTEFNAEWTRGLAAMGLDMKRAFDLAPHDADVLAGYGVYLSYVNRLPEAEEMVRTAVALNANDAHVLCVAATVLPYTGDPEDALALAERKLRLDPHGELSHSMCIFDPFFFGGRHDIVIDLVSRLPEERRGTFQWLMYGASLAYLGRDASVAKSTILSKEAAITAQQYYAGDWYFARDRERKQFFDMFRVLGLPLCATAEQLKAIAKPEPLPECPRLSP